MLPSILERAVYDELESSPYNPGEWPELPSWAHRVLAASDSDALSFEDMRDVYQFLRSTRELLKKSRLPLHDVYWKNAFEAIENLFSPEAFGCILDIREIIHSLCYKGLFPGSSYKSKQQLLSLPQKADPGKRPIDEDGERRLTKREKCQKYLEEGSRMARARQWQYRLENAISDAVEDNWFPLFGTYTVDPMRLPPECEGIRDNLWKNTPAWDRFVKRFKTEIADSCGFGRKPAKWPRGASFFRYFAVIEHGASGEHPHVHVIWLCKNIPDSWKRDPNLGSWTNEETDIRPASSLWEHGIQKETAALFITGSWFASDDNWRIPVDKRTGLPREVGSPGAVAGYVGKYLTKGATKKWNHRVKATKNLGMERVTQALKSIKDMCLLEALATRPAKYHTAMVLQLSTGCPMSLLRSKSKAELERRLLSSSRPQDNDSIRIRWTKKNTGFFMNLTRSVLSGTNPAKMNQEQRYNFYTRMLGAVSSTAHSREIVEKLVAWLDKYLANPANCKSYTLLQAELGRVA